MATPHEVTALRTTSLLSLDPDLGIGLTAAERLRAAREALVPFVDLERGPWRPSGYAGIPGRPYALLIVEGLLVCDLILGDVVTSELLGPSDLIETTASAHDLLPVVTRWTVSDPARLAVLDLRTRMFMHRWPAIGTALLERTVRQAARNSVHRAINQLPRVEDRLLAIFGYMAERWGRVGGGGIVIPLALTHESLGRLIGARRPTVSLALRDLAADGALGRRADGSWVLRFDAAAGVGGDAADPPPESDVRAVEEIRQRRAGRDPFHASAADRAALRARFTLLMEAHERRRERVAEALARSARVHEQVYASREGRARPAR